MNEVVIHPTAVIHSTAEIGGFDETPYKIIIGAGCIVHEGVRIKCDLLEMGENCKVHNHADIMAGTVFIGNNVWIGQRSHLDGTGTLLIDDDVTVGYNCYIWTHADRRGLPRPNAIRQYGVTHLKSKVWLVGCNVVVNPGVTMAEGSAALANSVVTHDTELNEIYAGVPARKIGRMQYPNFGL